MPCFFQVGMETPALPLYAFLINHNQYFEWKLNFDFCTFLLARMEATLFVWLTIPMTTSCLCGTGRERTDLLRLRYVSLLSVLQQLFFCTKFFVCASHQGSNESVFAADFHPTDSNVVVTCGKSHLCFWTLEKGILVKKQGLFEVNKKRHLENLNQSRQKIWKLRQSIKWCATSPSTVVLEHLFVYMFIAETREAQICDMCDLCGEWRCNNRRLQWQHPGVGKR